MNRLKKFFINAVAILLSFVCVIGLTACKEKIEEFDIKISMYNFEDEEYENYTLEIELYGHLAPKTVNAISKYLKQGYYNNTVFYKLTDSKFGNMFMIGDLKYDPDLAENEGFYLNDKKPTLPGEFKYGGTTGSNLTNKEGSIGLWRTWSAQDSNFNQGSTGMNTGSATWFIPNYTLATYDDYFCVFAQYDVDDSDNEETLEELNKLFSSSAYYQTYTIYFTGDYGTDGDGLTFHCVEGNLIDLNKDAIDNLFETEKNSSQYVCYNPYEIKVPINSDGEIAARIVSAKAK